MSDNNLNCFFKITTSYDYFALKKNFYYRKNIDNYVEDSILMYSSIFLDKVNNKWFYKKFNIYRLIKLFFIKLHKYSNDLDVILTRTKNYKIIKIIYIKRNLEKFREIV